MLELSSRVAEFRDWLSGYRKHGICTEPQAFVAFDALFAEWEQMARELERAKSVGAATPLDRVIAGLDEERAATDAMTASIARTNARLRTMREVQSASNVVVFPRAARTSAADVSSGARNSAADVSSGARASIAGNVSVETALAIIAGALDDDRDCAPCDVGPERGEPA